MVSDAIRNIRFDDVRAGHVLAALSGGADSVALLVLLARKRDAYGLTITAAHFHHGIRAGEADADAAFCRELCASLDVQLIEGRGDVPAMARQRHIGLETAAREARYAFLRDAQKQCGADVIALAHHLNDQAETILMHLLRGAGPDGLRGMARLQDGLYRPLLETPKQDLVQFLQAEGICWQEDSTNTVAVTPRNALRLHVLPEIEKNYPAAAQAIARCAQLCRIESDFVARSADAFLKDRLQTGPWGARLKIDGGEDEALLRRAVRALAGSLDMEKTDAITALAKMNRGRLDVSRKLRVEKTPGALYFLPNGAKIQAAVPLNLNGETLLPGICRIEAETGAFPYEPNDPMTEVFDAACLAGAVVRTRLEGDRIHPLGAPGERLLSDYLIDKKIDRPLRSWLPLVAAGSRILWAGGVGACHEARVQPDTQRMVRLTIYPLTQDQLEVQHEE